MMRLTQEQIDHVMSLVDQREELLTMERHVIRALLAGQTVEMPRMSGKQTMTNVIEELVVEAGYAYRVECPGEDCTFHGLVSMDQLCDNPNCDREACIIRCPECGTEQRLPSRN